MERYIPVQNMLSSGVELHTTGDRAMAAPAPSRLGKGSIDPLVAAVRQCMVGLARWMGRVQSRQCGHRTQKAGSDPFRASLDMSPWIDVTQWFHVLRLHLLTVGATDANGASDANSALFPLLLPNGASDA